MARIRDRLERSVPGHLGPAVTFVLLLGVVSLFSDMTYEAARSVTGPYLGTLGASAAVVGVVAGFGEFVGYGLRLGTGYLSDRTGRYWTLTVGGYLLNLVAVPLLALAGNWPLAAAFVVAERTGKAVRTPARDTMLSHATAVTGRGWGFGVHESLDQIGAVVGPLLVAGVLGTTGSFRLAFAALALPAAFAMVALWVARNEFPDPGVFEPEAASRRAADGTADRSSGRFGFDCAFWLYLFGTGLVAAGFADFALVAFHLHDAGLVPDSWIPLLYALAMGVDAVAALGFGRLYDRLGAATLVVVVLVSAAFAPLVFLGGSLFAAVGVALWGAGMAARESVIRAVVADLVPADRRGASYGVFDTGYGLAWFAGSAVMGVLYGVSLPLLVTFSVGVQLAAIPVVLAVRGELGRGPRRSTVTRSDDPP